MIDEATNIPDGTEIATPAKKPYVKPQLHLLSASSVEGKNAFLASEYAPSVGPS